MDRLGDERPRTVDPRGDPGRSPALNIAAEARRNFNSRVDCPSESCALRVGRATQLLEIGAAFVALVMVEDGKGQGIDIVRDPEAEDEHQERYR
jgi:hypothetical protein